MNNYQLNKTTVPWEKTEPFSDSIKKLFPLFSGEKKSLIITFIAILLSSWATLLTPIIISRTVDDYIVTTQNYSGILMNSAILLVLFILGWIASYIQTKTMGGVGRRSLFRLRNQIFTKLQSLPVAFFNQNKSGDLISRINNDTDKLNQFISQALMQFLANFFLIIGAWIFLVSLNPLLWLATLSPALCVLIFTQILSPWIKKVNSESLKTTGYMSSEIQESLSNFKVIIAFNRLDYFKKKFDVFNKNNYEASIKAGIASNIFVPIYGLAANLAQMIAIVYGIHLIFTGNMTIGLLIGFQIYVVNFYNPLRQLASVWSSLQLALASLDRVAEVTSLESDMSVILSEQISDSSAVMEFQHVNFQYPDGKKVLENINFTLQKGKTYALVWPTGGGKTTTALLMARLYDPTQGRVLLNGRDIRSYDESLRTDKIGFILQEPFLFTGNIRENILYWNNELTGYSNNQLLELLETMWLTHLLSKFDQWLDTEISSTGESISLGQKQLLAFIRAILKKPDILILDEATANIDTVTEVLLETILQKLPESTTKIIIAHRLNTIKDADEIFFVNSGEITNTGSMEQALEMLLHGKRSS